MNVKYGKDNLCRRLIGYTVVGQLIDTTVFGLIAFSGILGFNEMIIFSAFGWLFKTAVEVIMLPVTYKIIAFLKKNEHQDALDKKTNFTPFSTNI